MKCIKHLTIECEDGTDDRCGVGRCWNRQIAVWKEDVEPDDDNIILMT